MKFRQNIPGFNPLWLVFCASIFTYTGLWGQSKTRLEKERMEIIEKIDYTSRLLEQKNRERIATTEDLKLIQDQIDNRKKIIENIRRSILLTEEQLGHQKLIQDSLLQKHRAKLHNYHKLIRMSYIRMLTENKLVYLLSSKSWSESLYRIRSIRTIENYLFRQIKAMSDQSKKIGIALKKIRSEQADLQDLLKEEEISINSLENDEAIKDQILANLESDQEKLKQDLEKQRKAREALNREIERTILSALGGSDYAAVTEKDNKPIVPKTDISKLRFSKQKKLLPWPVDRGVIVSAFGRQKHPSLKDVIIANNGIDISCVPGSNIKAVFEGNVVRVMQITGNNMMIILKHGEYFTVYSRMSEVKVSQGQSVEAGQILGSLPETGESILHFQVWKDKIKLDPEDWLRKQSN